MKRESSELFWMFATALLGVALVIVAMNLFAEQIARALYLIVRALR
jgi:hypothetical protein